MRSYMRPLHSWSSACMMGVIRRLPVTWEGDFCKCADMPHPPGRSKNMLYIMSTIRSHLRKDVQSRDRRKSESAAHTLDRWAAGREICWWRVSMSHTRTRLCIVHTLLPLTRFFCYFVSLRVVLSMSLGWKMWSMQENKRCQMFCCFARPPWVKDM